VGGWVAATISPRPAEVKLPRTYTHVVVDERDVNYEGLLR
jgi:hypothetical protein